MRALLLSMLALSCSSPGARLDAGAIDAAVEVAIDAGPERSDEFVVRRWAIADLEGIERPSGVTTAALGRRRGPTVEELGLGLTLKTRCEANFCIDGVFRGDEPLLSPKLSFLEAPSRKTGHWLERVVRVTWQDEHFISMYVAQSEFSGGAHANNLLRCLTLDRRTGRVLRLQDVLTSGGLLFEKARKLFDVELSMNVLGVPLDPSGQELREDGFRLAPWKGSWQVVLCAEGAYPSESDTILELRAEAIPPGYLLR